MPSRITSSKRLPGACIAKETLNVIDNIERRKLTWMNGNGARTRVRAEDRRAYRIQEDFFVFTDGNRWAATEDRGGENENILTRNAFVRGPPLYTINYLSQGSELGLVADLDYSHAGRRSSRNASGWA